jgi:SAM-dependent methyltransferase
MLPVSAWFTPTAASVADPLEPGNPASVDLSASAANENEALRGFLDIALRPEPWNIDSVVYEDGHLEIIGWAIPPQGRHASVSFVLNGQEFAEIDYPQPRPDVAELFWYKPGIELTGFRCRTPVERRDVFRNGYATLEYVSRETRKLICDDHTYYFADDLSGVALPDGPRRKRVSGSEQPICFCLDGFTTFMKLDRALQRFGGKGLAEFRRILDWGCGCGRITRYFGRLGECLVSGADIDADNLQWCRENLSFGTFHQFPLQPPTKLKPASFDLIFGISVFTHLREGSQLEWLAELSRLLRPGGIALVTVLGPSTMCRFAFNGSLLEEWQQTGFVSMANNEDLIGHINDDSYYVNSLVTPEYIGDVWSRFFAVKGIIPAYIGNHQDLVVLRKPT